MSWNGPGVTTDRRPGVDVLPGRPRGAVLAQPGAGLRSFAARCRCTEPHQRHARDPPCRPHPDAPLQGSRHSPQGEAAPVSPTDRTPCRRSLDQTVTAVSPRARRRARSAAREAGRRGLRPRATAASGPARPSPPSWAGSSAAVPRAPPAPRPCPRR